jgi:hypothetical protein
MALSELFTMPFLISLGITLLLVGFLGMFLTQKMMEQNHKISSMIGLVTTMAEELNFVRSRMQLMNYGPNSEATLGSTNYPTVVSANLVGGMADPLIPVSDGDEDDDDDEDDESDSESESGSDSDSESGSESESESKKNIVEEGTIKVISMDVGDIQFENLHEAEEAESDSEDKSEDEDTMVDSEDLEETEPQTISVEEPVANDSIIDLLQSEIKSIPVDLVVETDYKKMSIQQLRSAASSKGFKGDINKFKKTELVKFLEDQAK